MKDFNDVWRVSGFRIITLIVKFITILKTGNEKTKFKLLTKKTFHTIRDIASSFLYFKTKNMFYDHSNLIETILYQF